MCTKVQQSFSRQVARYFLDNVPKLPSYCCRQSTSKLYLEPILSSKSQLYSEYSNWKFKRGNRKFIARRKPTHVTQKQRINEVHLTEIVTHWSWTVTPVKIAPLLDASARYYKTKLVHNFTT
ncbi:hypothetical protein Fcan01_15384 [Folsomia candida]|uniref:Uncharacterized protein n=1 Tax=Folsomia candida TaxID=158441 RepID=A0A226DV32_FOLCA|nr:hypothetical protein Fcan01_15384 [Folsomia candida]